MVVTVETAKDQKFISAKTNQKLFGNKESNQKLFGNRESKTEIRNILEASIRRSDRVVKRGI